MERTAFLKECMREARHKAARISIPEDWDVSELRLSLLERKAAAVAMVFDRMPLYIGPREWIVGTRTVYGRPGDDSGDRSYFDYQALPRYVNQADRDFFGFDMEFVTQAHYAPDFSIVLGRGIGALIEAARAGERRQGIPEVRREFYRAEAIALEGLSRLILRYADYAREKSLSAQGEERSELERIARVCESVALQPARDYYQACQLFWFAYLGCIVENFQFINYGRIDQALAPCAGTLGAAQEQQLTECLLLKMFDMYDIKLMDRTLMGVYSAQHNITVGGVTRAGADAANAVTRMVLTGLGKTRMPEPLVSVRVSSQNAPWLRETACALSARGLNCVNYYNDDLYVQTLNMAGLRIEDARDYGIGLCQDVLIPGRGDHYCSGGVNLIFVLMDVLSEHRGAASYARVKQAFLERIRSQIDQNLEHYNRWERAVMAFNDGDPRPFIDGYKNGAFDVFAPAQGLAAAQSARSQAGQARAEIYAHSLMSPLPITSALYHGCMESGVDVARGGCVNGDKGAMVLTPVLAVNALVAIKKVVFEEGRATLDEVLRACEENFAGREELRQRLWNAPKWGNDDDYADQEAVEVLGCALDEINRHATPKGGRHLGGLHQPHPVFAGRGIPATPNGRLAGAPISVTISPENGTVRRGPTAAMRSAAKIDWRKVKWNNCLMLQYYASAFRGAEGPAKLWRLTEAFFSLGGMQHQPNIVNVEDLKRAQAQPDAYRDLIIRMWGVSAYFVDLPRDVQDEFISRYDGL